MNYKEEQDLLWESLDFFDDMVGKTPLPDQVEALERNNLEDALIEFNGNRSKAAESLGIGRTNLIAKIRKYKL